MAVVLAYAWVQRHPAPPRPIVPPEASAPLAKVIPDLTLQGSFEESLATLSRMTGVPIRVGSPEIFEPLQGHTAGLMIDIPAPGPVDLHLRDVTVGDALALLLRQSAGDRFYAAAEPDGTVFITGDGYDADCPKIARMYDLRWLSGEADRFSAEFAGASKDRRPTRTGTSGAEPNSSRDQFRTLLGEILPGKFDLWEQGLVGNRLFLVSTPHAHQRLAALLSALAGREPVRQLAESGGTQ